MAVSACGSAGAAAPFSPDVKDGTVIAVADRRAAPVLTGKDLDGNPLSLTSFKGQVVVVNSYASWCDPCKGEAPALEATYELEKSQGVAFLGIGTRDNAANLRTFTKNYDITYPSIVDEVGDVIVAFKALPLAGIPSTVVVDRDGRLAARFIGGVTRDDLTKVVDQLAAEKA